MAWAGVLADGHNPNALGPFAFPSLSCNPDGVLQILFTIFNPQRKEIDMKPVISRYQSQLLFSARSYKPKRILRIRPDTEM